MVWNLTAFRCQYCGSDAGLRFRSQSFAEKYILPLFLLNLIIWAAPDESFDHEGMSPQRIKDNSGRGSFGFWQMVWTGWVGAMLYLRTQAGSSEAQSKCSFMICIRRESL